MKKMLLKKITIAIAIAFCATNISAQGFFKKLEKVTNKVESKTFVADSTLFVTFSSFLKKP